MFTPTAQNGMLNDANNGFAAFHAPYVHVPVMANHGTLNNRLAASTDCAGTTISNAGVGPPFTRRTRTREPAGGATSSTIPNSSIGGILGDPDVPPLGQNVPNPPSPAAAAAAAAAAATATTFTTTPPCIIARIVRLPTVPSSPRSRSGPSNHFSGAGGVLESQPLGVVVGFAVNQSATSRRLSQFVYTDLDRSVAFVRGSLARDEPDQNRATAARSYVFPDAGTKTGSRNIARVMGQSKCSGSSIDDDDDDASSSFSSRIASRGSLREARAV
jgi:hypothetical protein